MFLFFQHTENTLSELMISSMHLGALVLSNGLILSYLKELLYREKNRLFVLSSEL